MRWCEVDTSSALHDLAIGSEFDVNRCCGPLSLGLRMEEPAR